MWLKIVHEHLDNAYDFACKKREEACYNRRQLAEILGISYNALRLYKEGKKTLPFDAFYKMS